MRLTFMTDLLPQSCDCFVRPPLHLTALPCSFLFVTFSFLFSMPKNHVANGQAVTSPACADGRRAVREGLARISSRHNEQCNPVSRRSCSDPCCRRRTAQEYFSERSLPECR